jgi:hypothetical protein
VRVEAESGCQIRKPRPLLRWPDMLDPLRRQPRPERVVGAESGVRTSWHS